jgi:hypothetical protein
VSTVPSESKHLRNLAPLGAALGLLLALPAWALIVRHAMPRSGLALARAREMGLISQTVLENYDKAQEGNAWLLGCLLVPLGMWAGWRALRGMPSAGRRARVDDEQAPSNVPRWVPWVAVATVFVSVMARPSFLHGPNPWGTFGFLGEEGVYLGAVQAMRTGRVLYADLAFPYGPLLIQPLDWFLRLAGDSVVAARLWVLFLNGLGVLAIAAAVSCFVGRRRGSWAAAVAAVAIAAVVPPFLPTLNGVLLRPAMALLPVAVAHAACTGRLGEGRRPFLLTGVLVAIGGLLSFEIAGVAVLSTAAALLVHRVGRERHAQVWGACLGAGVIGLLPLFVQGGLPAFFEQALDMVRLPTLGYQALPYPDAAALFTDAAGNFGTYVPTDTPTLVWAVLPPLVIWAALGMGAMGATNRAGATTRGLLLAAIAGAILFRGALGRSDLYHLWFYGAVPVVTLAIVMLALLWDRAPDEGKAGLVPIAALALIGLVALDTEEQIAFPESEERRLGEALAIEAPLVERPIRVGRTGRLRLLPRLASQVEAITLRAMALPPEDGVWFYPSEATFYFLANRRVPLRYLWAYDAATPAMQVRAIADLEASKPRWVFRSTDTFEIDHIPQQDLVPLVDAWLASHYRAVQVLPGTTLLERIGEGTEER